MKLKIKKIKNLKKIYQIRMIKIKEEKLIQKKALN